MRWVRIVMSYMHAFSFLVIFYLPVFFSGLLVLISFEFSFLKNHQVNLS